MAKELSKIEKPSTEEFKKGRKLFFVPLVHKSKSSPNEYKVKVKKYWLQVDKQLADLEYKLGQVNKIYHEFVSSPDREGAKIVKELDSGNYQIVKSMVGKGAKMEAVEDAETLSAFMDWSRCLASVRNQQVFDTISQYYIEASKKRNESIANRLKETLKQGDIGVLFMRENHQVQFPQDIELFYIAPPTLDEINRWLRDSAVQSPEKRSGNAVKG